ncbi:unnamed protein product [Orchesella dallaii]|uniref:Uncharacterized protein n=1 Tax=Orchesella dallaii TaxID=48710 RepID=A0ABP1QSY2_9HEXA
MISSNYGRLVRATTKYFGLEDHCILLHMKGGFYSRFNVITEIDEVSCPNKSMPLYFIGFCWTGIIVFSGYFQHTN